MIRTRNYMPRLDQYTIVFPPQLIYWENIALSYRFMEVQYSVKVCFYHDIGHCDILENNKLSHTRTPKMYVCSR